MAQKRNQTKAKKVFSDMPNRPIEPGHLKVLPRNLREDLRFSGSDGFSPKSLLAIAIIGLTLICGIYFGYQAYQGNELPIVNSSTYQALEDSSIYNWMVNKAQSVKEAVGGRF